ncbi:MAG: DUF1501 domain-containing protein [Planctomycetaceae bacterium]
MLRLVAKRGLPGGPLGRRRFLTAGAMGAAGLGLSDLLRAEHRLGVSGSRKSVINVHLDGGPPHMDMIDLKPEAPAEIRGEFLPIDTKLSGFQICELMPRLATVADQVVWIRSLVGSAGAHDAFQCQSGFGKRDLQSIGGRPALGSVLARLFGTPNDPAPTFIDLMQGRPLVRNSARPGFLGPAYQAFRPDISGMFQRDLEEGMKTELARLGKDHATSLVLNPNLTLDRLQDRTSLLSQLDRIRRDADSSGMMSALDSFGQQAVGVLTSGKLAAALDLEQVSPDSLRKYTPHIREDNPRFQTAEGASAVKKFLLARRMIEAGVRCVSISISDFDTHSNNFPRMKNLLPLVDFGLHALLTDLQDRDMLADVSVVVWGEFGRTPRVDAKTGGRHHWPRVGPAMMFGGGMAGGQVIGATDRTGGGVVSRPVQYKDVFATLYHNLGINPRQFTLDDPRGRPQYLLDEGVPLSEV